MQQKQIFLWLVFRIGMAIFALGLQQLIQLLL